MNQTGCSRHQGYKSAITPSGDPGPCVRPLMMISVIPTDVIWLAVIFTMVMAGFLAAAPE